MRTILDIQKSLIAHGYAIQADGIIGPETERAIAEFKSDRGLWPRPYVGPVTESLLFPSGPDDSYYPPWLSEIAKFMNLHETDDNVELSEWLKSDGTTLGNPAQLPWCGDAAETAIKNTLPDEPFPGALGKNPYWARNWALFGIGAELKLGSIVVLERGSGGHVGFAVGCDPNRKLIKLRGGNQRNRVCDVWVDGSENGDGGRVIAIRQPKTWRAELPKVAILNSRYERVSKNEA